jgi:hypothetical protein
VAGCGAGWLLAWCSRGEGQGGEPGGLAGGVLACVAGAGGVAEVFGGGAGGGGLGGVALGGAEFGDGFGEGGEAGEQDEGASRTRGARDGSPVRWAYAVMRRAAWRSWFPAGVGGGGWPHGGRAARS